MITSTECLNWVRKKIEEEQRAKEWMKIRSSLVLEKELDIESVEEEIRELQRKYGGNRKEYVRRVQGLKDKLRGMKRENEKIRERNRRLIEDAHRRLQSN